MPEKLFTSAISSDTLSWYRPRFEDRENERAAMVRVWIQGAGNYVTDQNVLAAMRNVPRHLFVPQNIRRAAYQDRPLPIGHGQTISQPFIVAYMTELLNLNPGEKVLEIGTGSGYQAAVLSELTPEVYTIEIIDDLGKSARQRFQELAYQTIRVKIGDGYYGWEEHAPFDAITVTAASGHVPPPLVQQLKPGGRLIIPLGGVYQLQSLVLVTKNHDGSLHTRQLMPVRFVPLTGTALGK